MSVKQTASVENLVRNIERQRKSHLLNHFRTKASLVSKSGTTGYLRLDPKFAKQSWLRYCWMVAAALDRLTEFKSVIPI